MLVESSCITILFKPILILLYYYILYFQLKNLPLSIIEYKIKKLKVVLSIIALELFIVLL